MLAGWKAVSLFVILVSLANGVTLQGACTTSDPGLRYLSTHLSSAAALSCDGQPLQQQNAGRYWGTQYSKNASAVVYPATPDDVSAVMDALPMTPLSDHFAFVSGAHSTANESSASGLIMDLSLMKQVSIIDDFEIDNGSSFTAIRYEGGCIWGDVYNATAGSGWTAVGARDSDVGVGGFSTGGGIGFLAGAYGYAIDRLVALDVVLLNGSQVRATKNNEFGDLFWAFQGGTGQFGVVTSFYQEAAPEPTSSEIGLYFIDDDQLDLAQTNTLNFFKDNTDPFSLIYYAPDYIGSSLANLSSNQTVRTLIFALRFNDPLNPNQPDYNTTFAPLLSGLSTVNSQVLTMPFAMAANIAGPFFPRGLRRGFWGPQVPSNRVTKDYLNNLTATMRNYTDILIANGDDATSTSFVLQYMFPGLNGHLPPSYNSTAWPHALAGHQTLFSPGWTHASNDQLTIDTNNALSEMAWNLQRDTGVELADYPNYMSPGVAGGRLYGDHNLVRLAAIKDKYDPECYLQQGRVFTSFACIERHAANLWPFGLGSISGGVGGEQ